MNLREVIQDALFAHVSNHLEDFQGGESVECTVEIPNPTRHKMKWCFDAVISVAIQSREINPYKRLRTMSDGSEELQDDGSEDVEIIGLTIEIESLMLCDFSDGGKGDHLIMRLESPEEFTFKRNY